MQLLLLFSQCKVLYFENDVKTCLLLPARTDTKWFHMLNNLLFTRIVFIQGRLKFGNSKNSAPFPSMLVFIGF